MPPRRLLVGHEAELVAAYRAGATLEELARGYGGSVMTVRSVLGAEGVTLRTPGRKPAIR